ncbi:MAG: hypothetical protein HPY76_15085, partial [Anaerolineae bacterium]|nr:hypothetical protein [Anaerolineae bacterium]
ESGLYTELPSLAAATINTNIIRSSYPNMDVLMAQISPETWGQIYASIFTREFIQENVNEITLQTFSYVNFETQSLTYTVDLTTLKNDLRGDRSSVVAGLIVDALPDCDPDSYLTLLEKILSGQLYQTQICKLPEPYIAYIENFMIQSIQIIGNSLPDEITIDPETDFKQSSNNAPVSFKDILRIARILRVVITILPFLALGMIALLMLVTFRSAHEILSFTGWGFTIGGIASLLISLLGFGFRSMASETFFQAWRSTLGDQAMRLVVEISVDVISKFTLTAAWIAGITMITGILMFAGRYLLNR